MDACHQRICLRKAAANCAGVRLEDRSQNIMEDSFLQPYVPIETALIEKRPRQRLGSLVNPLEAKNSCSPTVKVKSDPHSTQVRVLSESMLMTFKALCWRSRSYPILTKGDDTYYGE